MQLQLSPELFFSLEAFEHKALFEGCAFVWEGLTRLKAYLESYPFQGCRLDPSVHLVHPEMISIGEGTIVEPGVMICGPCVIGKNCEIRQGAYIRGHVVVGDGCIVGHVTEVKHSIFLNGAKAAHFNYIGDSILGNQVNLGAGAKCANLKLDHGIVSVRVEGKKVVTGLSKLGAILGDEAQVGCNCVLNPGTFLGRGTIVYPGLNAHGYIRSGKMVVR